MPYMCSSADMKLKKPVLYVVPKLPEVADKTATTFQPLGLFLTQRHNLTFGLLKQNIMRNSNFKVSASTFQPELNKLQKCPKLSSKTPFLGGFLNFVQIWLKSRG